MRAEPLLRVRGLTVSGPGLTPVRGVDLTIALGERLALVGESGCGKSLLALALLGLLPPPLQAQGVLHLDGRSLAPKDLPPLRGKTIALIPQDQGGALNPLMRVGPQVVEALELPHRQAEARAVALLAGVGLAAPWARAYPHELSGGMRQRALLAMALAQGPRLIIADEPTAALDGLHKAMILKLFQEQRRVALLLITHDLLSVATASERVMVLYAGQVMERLPSARLDEARHPYTQALLRAQPRLTGPRLPVGLPGRVPEPSEPLTGCPFASRCPVAQQACRERPPPTVTVGPDHEVACLLF